MAAGSPRSLVLAAFLVGVGLAGCQAEPPPEPTAPELPSSFEATYDLTGQVEGLLTVKVGPSDVLHPTGVMVPGELATMDVPSCAPRDAPRACVMTSDGTPRQAVFGACGQLLWAGDRGGLRPAASSNQAVTLPFLLMGGMPSRLHSWDNPNGFTYTSGAWRLPLGHSNLTIWHQGNTWIAQYLLEDVLMIGDWTIEYDDRPLPARFSGRIYDEEVEATLIDLHVGETADRPPCTTPPAIPAQAWGEAVRQQTAWAPLLTENLEAAETQPSSGLGTFLRDHPAAGLDAWAFGWGPIAKLPTYWFHYSDAQASHAVVCVQTDLVPVCQLGTADTARLLGELDPATQSPGAWVERLAALPGVATPGYVAVYLDAAGMPGLTFRPEGVVDTGSFLGVGVGDVRVDLAAGSITAWDGPGPHTQ